MAAFDDLPPLADHAFFLIVLLLVDFWLYMRVAITRARLAGRDASDGPPDGIPRWQLRLAGWRWTGTVLVGVGVLLAAALAVLGVTK